MDSYYYNSALSLRIVINAFKNVKKMNGMLCDVMIISYGVISHSFLKYTKAFKTNNYDMKYLDHCKKHRC